jgi:hypothetical protein
VLRSVIGYRCLTTGGDVQLCPDADFTQELGAHIDRETWAAEREREKDSSVPRLGQPSSPPRSLGALAPGAPIFHDDKWGGDDEDKDCITMSGNHGIGSLTGFEGRFHGKSSGVMLAMAARDLKKEYTGNEQTQLPPPLTARRPEFWQPGPVSTLFEVSSHPLF